MNRYHIEFVYKEVWGTLSLFSENYIVNSPSELIHIVIERDHCIRNLDPDLVLFLIDLLPAAFCHVATLVVKQFPVLEELDGVIDRIIRPFPDADDVIARSRGR